MEEFYSPSINAEMYPLMEWLSKKNADLPYERKLPGVLFLALTWAMYEWNKLFAEGVPESRDEQLEMLEWWREKSGYNDLLFIKDRFWDMMTEEDRRVINEFEDWGTQKHFFLCVDRLIAGTQK